MNMHVTTKHVMDVMDSSGHTSVTWDPTDEASVNDARREFTRLTGEGYQAYRMEAVGEHAVVENKGARITEFDPEAGRLLLIPHRVGG
jgi:hypothetical protein